MSTEKWFENPDRLTVGEIVKLESQYRIDSLVCAMEERIMNKIDNDLEPTDEEVVVLAIEAMEREVNNGGFAQFCSNDSWRYIPCLVKCLANIGAVKTKAIAEQAVSALGISPMSESSDPDEYYEKLQEIVEDEEVAEKLEQCDSAYYETGEDIAGLLFSFVKQNVAKIEA